MSNSISAPYGVGLISFSRGIGLISAPYGVGVVMPKKVIRGNPVTVTVNFLNSAGQPLSAQPNKVTLYLHYTLNTGAFQTDNLSMTYTTNVGWQATWNSAQAESGDIDYSAQGVDSSGNPMCAEDGTFELIANRANPDPASTPQSALFI